MHTVHAIDNNEDADWKFAVVGIFFSVDESNADLTPKETEIVDNFFESLRWDDDEV